MERTQDGHTATSFFRDFPAGLLREVRPQATEEHILGRFSFGWWFSVPVAFLIGRYG
jgi:hypothetical protein